MSQRRTSWPRPTRRRTSDFALHLGLVTATWTGAASIQTAGRQPSSRSRNPTVLSQTWRVPDLHLRANTRRRKRRRIVAGLPAAPPATRRRSPSPASTGPHQIRRRGRTGHPAQKASAEIKKKRRRGPPAGLRSVAEPPLPPPMSPPPAGPDTMTTKARVTNGVM